MRPDHHLRHCALVGPTSCDEFKFCKVLQEESPFNSTCGDNRCPFADPCPRKWDLLLLPPRSSAPAQSAFKLTSAAATDELSVLDVAALASTCVLGVFGLIWMLSYCPRFNSDDVKHGALLAVRTLRRFPPWDVQVHIAVVVDRPRDHGKHQSLNARFTSWRLHRWRSAALEASIEGEKVKCENVLRTLPATSSSSLVSSRAQESQTTTVGDQIGIYDNDLEVYREELREQTRMCLRPFREHSKDSSSSACIAEGTILYDEVRVLPLPTPAHIPLSPTGCFKQEFITQQSPPCKFEDARLFFYTGVGCVGAAVLINIAIVFHLFRRNRKKQASGELTVRHGVLWSLVGYVSCYPW